ncbi:MAG: sugar transferase [Solirubrobacterales bacterium]|nr:sugar transferase [Solirubrobacterales bacterium]
MERHRVKPGLTGWAQIHRPMARAESIELDCYYIAHWSLWLDLKIAALTVALMFRGTE